MLQEFPQDLFSQMTAKLTMHMLDMIPNQTKKKQTRAPATPIFLPIRIMPLLTALARGASIWARSLYHPSVTSSSGCGSIGKPSSEVLPVDQVILETHSTIG